MIMTCQKNVIHRFLLHIIRNFNPFLISTSTDRVYNLKADGVWAAGDSGLLSWQTGNKRYLAPIADDTTTYNGYTNINYSGADVTCIDADKSSTIGTKKYFSKMRMTYEELLFLGSEQIYRVF